MEGLIDAAPMSATDVDAMFAAPAEAAAAPQPVVDAPVEQAAPAAAAPEPSQQPTAQPAEQIEPEALDIAEALESLNEEKAPETAAKPEEQPAETAAEEVPDATVETDANGKKFIKVPLNRWQHIYNGSYKVSKEIAAELGVERLTPELVRNLSEADKTVRAMRLDLLSGNPAQQRQLFGYFFGEAESALRSGDAVQDPLPAAIETFLGMAQQARPQVFERLRGDTIRGAVDEWYRIAAKTGNENLLAATQNIDHHLTGTFKKREQIPIESDVDLRLRELTQKEEQIKGFQREQAEREWEGFTASSRRTVNETVAGVLDGMLGKVKGLDDERRKNVRARLDSELKQAFTTEQWREADRLLFQEAGLAAPQRRGAIAQELAKRYKAKAQMVLRDSLPRAVNAETSAQKRASDDRMARVQSQQGKTPIPTAGIPIQPHVPSLNGKGMISAQDWSSALDTILQG